MFRDSNAVMNGCRARKGLKNKSLKDTRETTNKSVLPIHLDLPEKTVFFIDRRVPGLLLGSKVTLFHKLSALLVKVVDLQLHSMKQSLQFILPAQQAVYIIHRALHTHTHTHSYTKRHIYIHTHTPVIHTQVHRNKSGCLAGHHCFKFRPTFHNSGCLMWHLFQWARGEGK